MLAQRTFWLDASNNLLDNVAKFKKEPGSLMVALNEWTDYFNVRINQLDLKAGTEVIMRVRPIQHTTSKDFRALSLEERKCRLMHENEVSTYGTAMIAKGLYLVWWSLFLLLLTEQKQASSNY